MPDKIQPVNYGAALDAVNKRAPTRDAAWLGKLSDAELHAEHARANSATLSEQIRRELSRRGL